MTTRTAHTKGLDRPHKAVAAVKGEGSARQNVKSIATERSVKGPKSSGGVASSYFGNSKACNTEK